ncbi:MAG: hypothetical protein ACTHQM_25865 [Thermoanaerobaculia bacterium]
MTLHRIEHAIVMDTDDVPGRGGYAVVGISPRVSPAERSFIASNFGISDYLHDPKTENRIFYSTFRIPGSERRAFVRRFARGNELRRNNTQRRLVVHTLLLDENVWSELHALPWLLLNASIRLEGATQWNRLRAESPWIDDGSTLPALEWDSDDGATSNAWKRVTDRLALIQHGEPNELLARMITALSQRARVALPQDMGWEWATMLAWSMLPRRDRDELAWTQHDSMNLSGIAFALANVPGGEFDPSHVQPAAFAHELVQMNVASDASWLDLQRRTNAHALSIRNASDLHEWGRWRNALLELQRHIDDANVVERMTALARAAKNPRAGWIDAEEVLRLIWTHVNSEVAATQWGQRLRESGLAKIVFSAIPSKSWLSDAAKSVGADPLLWFFLSGGGEDESSSGTRAALAEWIVDTRPRISAERIAQLAYLLAKDYAPQLKALVEVLLDARDGLTALTRALDRHASGDVQLLHTAVPSLVNRPSANTLTFLRTVFVPRFDPKRIDVALARAIASALREDSDALATFLKRLPTEVAGPVATGLAQTGEPASVWLDVLLRLARPIDETNDTNAARDFAEMIRALGVRNQQLDGAMPLLVDFIRGNPRAREAIRAIVLMLRPVWNTDSRFARALISLLKRAPNVIAWEEVVVAYANDARDDVSELAAEWWMLVDPAVATQSAALIDLVHGEPRLRLVSYWKDRVKDLKPSMATDKLLALVQHTSKSYDVERDLAVREIKLGTANAQTLNRLEAALFRIHGPSGTRQFLTELDAFLGEDNSTRATRALQLLASDDCHPSVKVALLQSVLPDVLRSLRGRDWDDVRKQTRDEELLSVGVVPRLAYAVGARASGRTIGEFEAVWKRSGRNDALDALQAGRATRGPLQWLARRMRIANAPIQM